MQNNFSFFLHTKDSLTKHFVFVKNNVAKTNFLNFLQNLIHFSLVCTETQVILKIVQVLGSSLSNMEPFRR